MTQSKNELTEAGRRVSDLVQLYQQLPQFSRNRKDADIMNKYDHNAHSVFLLYYHLILVVKYRRKVLSDDISDRAKEIFCYIAPRYGLTLEEWKFEKRGRRLNTVKRA